MENNGTKVQMCFVDPDTVNVPRDEYDELVCALNGIRLIGETIGRFGPNDDIVKAVCGQFGYHYKEPEDPADA